MNEFQIKNGAGEVMGTIFCREVYWMKDPTAAGAGGDGFFMVVFGGSGFSAAGVCFLQAGWSVQKVTK